jgi:hypothetical protein
MGNSLTPIFADLFEGWGMIIVAVITLIGWLMSFVNQKNAPPPPVRNPRIPNPAGRRDDRLSNEIDIFLQEVSGRKRQDEPVEIELVPEDEIRERSSRRKQAEQSQRPGNRKLQSSLPNKSEKHLGSKIAERHLTGPDQLGQGLQDHLAESMQAGRIKKHVAAHLDHDVNRSVEQHLGRFGGADLAVPTTTRKESAAARKVVKLLRDPDGVRQAILINEVLSRPVGMRKNK